MLWEEIYFNFELGGWGHHFDVQGALQVLPFKIGYSCTMAKDARNCIATSSETARTDDIESAK